METATEIKQWGNSLGLRITKAMAGEAMLKKGTKVLVTSTPDGITIEPLVEKEKYKMPFSEAELLSNLDEYTAHTDETT